MTLQPPPDARKVVAAHGTLFLWQPLPSVLHCKMVGHMGEPHWRELLRTSDAALAAGSPLTSFYDWQEMTGYDAEARTELTLWALAHVKHIDMAHILVKHKVVAAGVSIAGALVRTLKAYTDPAAFLEASQKTQRAKNAGSGA